MAQQTATWVPQQTFGTRLVMVRRHLGWNIRDAAEATGIDDGSWSNWERGVSPRDMARVVRKIHDATGVDMGWLMWGSGSPDQGLPRSTWTADNVLDLQTRRTHPLRSDDVAELAEAI